MSHTNRLKFKAAKDRYRIKVLGQFEEIGKSVSAEQQENLVRGALLNNIAQGKDEATASLKMLGSDKRVNMFQPESASGVIIIQAVPIPPFDPPDVPSRYLSCGCYDYCRCRKALP